MNDPDGPGLLCAAVDNGPTRALLVQTGGHVGDLAGSCHPGEACTTSASLRAHGAVRAFRRRIADRDAYAVVSTVELQLAGRLVGERSERRDASSWRFKRVPMPRVGIEPTSFGLKCPFAGQSPQIRASQCSTVRLPRVRIAEFGTYFGTRFTQPLRLEVKPTSAPPGLTAPAAQMPAESGMRCHAVISSDVVADERPRLPGLIRRRISGHIAGVCLVF
jgi:hypothetical protein